MQWLDEKGKVFGWIHWIDLLLVAAGLFVVTLSIVRLWPVIPARYSSQLRIEILTSNISPRVAESIQPGQWVRDARTGTFMGKIVEKRVTPHKVMHWVGEQLVSADSPLTQDLWVLLERQGEVREREGIYAGRQMIRAGTQGAFQTLFAEFDGQIQAVLFEPARDGQ